MLGLTELLNTVVTVKTVAGSEYIGKLIGLTEDGSYISLQNLKNVFLNENNQVMIMPFAFTSDEEIININMSGVFTVVKASEVAAEDYLRDIEEDQDAATV